MPATGGAPAATATAAAGPSQPSQAAIKVQNALKDALSALKVFATNPVPGLPKAFEQLGPARALSAGLAFGGICAICFLVWAYSFAQFNRPQGFGGFIRALIASAVPFATLFGACFGVRLIFRGQGRFTHDAFIAGAALLPIGLFALVSGILTAKNADIAFLILPFAFCTSILLLFSGCTRVLNLSERLTTLALPVMIIISAWLSKVIYLAMLRHTETPAMPFNFGQ